MQSQPPRGDKADLRDEQDDPKREDRAVDVYEQVRKGGPEHSGEKVRANKTYEDGDRRH